MRRALTSRLITHQERLHKSISSRHHRRLQRRRQSPTQVDRDLRRPLLTTNNTLPTDNVRPHISISTHMPSHLNRNITNSQDTFDSVPHTLTRRLHRVQMPAARFSTHIRNLEVPASPIDHHQPFRHYTSHVVTRETSLPMLRRPLHMKDHLERGPTR